MVTETRDTDPLEEARGPAETVQRVRDLKGEIGQLSDDPEDQKEIVIRETSPRARKISVWSMTDGEELQVPRKLLELILYKRDPLTGKYAFTARKHEAPAFKLGEVKCFLHAESNERPILAEIGLEHISCPAGHLANRFSKRMHAMHRHKQEWGMLQEFLNEQKEEQFSQRAQQQLEATLAIAKAAAVKPGKAN